jgi:hypothetical protein
LIGWVERSETQQANVEEVGEDAHVMSKC